jgi:hypothetical protein
VQLLQREQALLQPRVADEGRQRDGRERCVKQRADCSGIAQQRSSRMRQAQYVAEALTGDAGEGAKQSGSGERSLLLGDSWER